MIRVENLQRETTAKGQRIMFWTHDIQAIDEVIAKYHDKPLQVKFEPIRAHRSKDANSYMWVLADKIADAINSTKEEVYRKAIREVGVFHDGAYQRKDVPAIVRIWGSNGIGWFTDIFDSKLEGCMKLRFYHGSSLYDTKQMSRLIDYIVEEARQLGIDTATPDEIARMKSMWGDGS